MHTMLQDVPWQLPLVEKIPNQATHAPMQFKSHLSQCLKETTQYYPLNIAPHLQRTQVMANSFKKADPQVTSNLCKLYLEFGPDKLSQEQNNMLQHIQSIEHNIVTQTKGQHRQPANP